MSKATMTLMPVVAGACAVCASKHESNLAHNLHSLYYGMRFKIEHGRDPTWADAIAHLSDKDQAQWKAALRRANQKFTTTTKPISEPFVVSDGTMKTSGVRVETDV